VNEVQRLGLSKKERIERIRLGRAQIMNCTRQRGVTHHLFFHIGKGEHELALIFKVRQDSSYGRTRRVGVVDERASTPWFAEDHERCGSIGKGWRFRHTKTRGSQVGFEQVLTKPHVALASSCRNGNDASGFVGQPPYKRVQVPDGSKRL
jgi:hypothetical protein